MKHRISITTEQMCMIQAVIERLQNVLEWDEDMEKYTDNGNFCISLNEENYKTLMSIKLL